MSLALSVTLSLSHTYTHSSSGWRFFFKRLFFFLFFLFVFGLFKNVFPLLTFLRYSFPLFLSLFFIPFVSFFSPSYATLFLSSLLFLSRFPSSSFFHPSCNRQHICGQRERESMRERKWLRHFFSSSSVDHHASVVTSVYMDHSQKWNSDAYGICVGIFLSFNNVLHSPFFYQCLNGTHCFK